MKIVFKDNNKNLVGIKILVNVGSLDDTKNGIAHFVEHMVASEANPKIKKLQQKNIFLNAATEQDSIVFFTKVLRSETVFAVRQIMNIVFKSKLTDDVFEYEQNIILKEIEENEPSALEQKYTEFVKKIFGMNVHSERGTRDTVNNIKFSDVVNFYRDYFNSGNAVLLVSGKLNEEQKLSICALNKDCGDVRQLKFSNYKGAYEKYAGDDVNSYCFLFFPYCNLFVKEKLMYELFSIVYFSNLSLIWKELRGNLKTSYYMDYENVFLSGDGFLGVQINYEKGHTQKILECLNNCLSVTKLSKKLLHNAKIQLIKLVYGDFDENVNENAYLKRELFDKRITMEEQLKYISDITVSDFKNFVDRVLNNGYSKLIVE